MKGNPVNLTIPPGARVMTIAFGEKMVENDDEVRSAFEKAEQQGVASIALTPQENIRKATGLDILRMRGTPIDMIHSAVAAGDNELANAMFRTCILEYVYEKIQAIWPEDVVKFIHSKALARKDEQLGLEVEGPCRSIPLTPAFDAIAFGNHGLVPVCSIDGGRIHLIIHDDGDAAVMQIIEDLSERIADNIRDGMANAGVKKSTQVFFNLVVDISTVNIKIDETGIDAEASIPIVAYHTITD
jgi:hypothetical protein